MAVVENIKNNVDLIKLSDKEVYLIGTAHVSKASVDLVAEVIKEFGPDGVAVELCEAREVTLLNPDRWKNMDLFKVIRSGQSYVLMFQLMLAAFQRKIGKELGVKPGAEMLKALELAKELGASRFLVDRDVKITLKRAWRSLSFFSGIKLIVTALAGLFGGKDIDANEIERLKTGDALEVAMKEFGESMPTLQETLIFERDRYLAAKISAIPAKKIVAVVGAGHVPGIKNWIDKEVDLKALEEIPPGGWVGKFFSWLIPGLIIAAFVYGFFAVGDSAVVDMFAAWFWITGLTAAVGAALALAHPFSILSAFVAAPFTSLHPIIAAGWVSGLVEAFMRKPRVSDLESVLDDISTLKGFWTNRVMRVLLIVALTNLCGSIGMLIGSGVILSFVQ